MPQPLDQHAAVVDDDDDAPLWTPSLRRRLIQIAIVLLVVVLMVVIPPYISVSRYQRRVAMAISGALGRPVHFDNITIHLLPIPGLTIQNFVVNELPQFGGEPVLRANTVEARLRVSSLWRRRLEVSRISLDAPSINLVRRPEDGSWNLQSILMQASQLQSAPTAQARAGDAPRFPYIEATDARLNFKNGDDKLPFSLRAAEFALWLPEPGQWRLRLNAQPVRTDTDVNDVGLLRVEATLGRAADLASAPIDLTASWKTTPLGEASKLTAGVDMGWRGEVAAEATLKGTLGQAKLVTDVHLLALRRADFVPEHTAEINAHCEAIASGPLRSLQDLRCAVPTNQDTSMFSAIEVLHRFAEPASKPADAGEIPDADALPDGSLKPGVVLLHGDVPNLFNWHTVTLQVSLKNASAGYALAWLRLFSRRVPPSLQVGGTVDLNAWKEESTPTSSRWGGILVCDCTLPPVPAATPSSPPPAVAAAAPSPVSKPSPWNLVLTYGVRGSSTDASNAAIAVHAYRRRGTQDEPETAEAIAQKATAEGEIYGQLNRSGYTLDYRSAAAAQEAAHALPPLGDNMPADATGALQVQRPWAGQQTWTAATPAAHPSKTQPRHKHGA